MHGCLQLCIRFYGNCNINNPHNIRFFFLKKAITINDSSELLPILNVYDLCPYKIIPFLFPKLLDYSSRKNSVKYSDNKDKFLISDSIYIINKQYI